eukprot:TRINITY_DN20948_c0_g1_i2.p1 TRINITY_DN20948_c0_g1~~TRINITY_DN20948_c0_g1_i2.p1  ORF type:complete len:585 (+),score=82.87 TRINITY_DN20948_c0_g1_i2:34-1788(+)
MATSQVPAMKQAKNAVSEGSKAEGKIDSWGQVQNMLDPTMPKDPFRARIAMRLKSNLVEGSIGMVILTSMFLLIFETDATATGAEAPAWIKTVNIAFLIFYILELTFKLWVYRSAFFRDKANIVDACVVAFDLALTIASSSEVFSSNPSFRIVRIFRIIRLIRSFRILRQFSELNLLILSFEAAIKSIFWGMLMVLMMSTSFSVLAVELIHPLNYEIWKDDDSCLRCRNAFSSTWMSNVTIFQTVIAGDSWGQLALPLIDREPMTALFFGAVLVTISLSMLNLVLAVICDAAQTAKQEDDHQKAVLSEQEMMGAKDRLLGICKTIDVDGSGHLTISEFMSGFEKNEELADILKCMDITREDLNCVFNVLDNDGSGDINCYEFVDQLHRLKSQQSQQILFTVTEIKHLLIDHSQAWRQHQESLNEQPEVKLDQSCHDGDFNATNKANIFSQSGEAKINEFLKQLRQERADTILELGQEMMRSLKALEEKLVPTLATQSQMITRLHAERPSQHMRQLAQGQPKDLGDSKCCWGPSQGSSTSGRHAHLANTGHASGLPPGLPPYMVPTGAAQAGAAQAQGIGTYSST